MEALNQKERKFAEEHHALIYAFLESLLLMVSLVTPAASAMSLMAILFLAISARRFSNAIFVLAMLASLLF